MRKSSVTSIFSIAEDAEAAAGRLRPPSVPLESVESDVSATSFHSVMTASCELREAKVPRSALPSLLFRDALSRAEIHAVLSRDARRVFGEEHYEIPWSDLRNWQKRPVEDERWVLTQCKYGCTSVRVTIYKKDEANDTVSHAEWQMQQFIREVVVLLRLRHPHVITLMGIVTKNNPQGLALVTEVCAGGTVRDWMISGPTSGAAGFSIGLQLASAVEYIHRIECKHRAINPNNVFLVTTDRWNPYVKLSGFGLSSPLGMDPEVPLHRIVWAPGYTAPEVYQGRFGYAADVYALGVTVYECIAGRGVYTDEHITTAYRMVHGLPLNSQSGMHAPSTREEVIQTVAWMAINAVLPEAAAVDRVVPGVFAILKSGWGPEADRISARTLCTRLNVTQNAIRRALRRKQQHQE